MTLRDFAKELSRDDLISVTELIDYLRRYDSGTGDEFREFTKIIARACEALPTLKVRRVYGTAYISKHLVKKENDLMLGRAAFHEALRPMEPYLFRWSSTEVSEEMQIDSLRYRAELAVVTREGVDGE